MYRPLFFHPKSVFCKVIISQVFIRGADGKRQYFTFYFKAFYNKVLALDKPFYWFAPHTAIQRNNDDRRKMENRDESDTLPQHTSENIAMLSTIIHCRNPPLCHIKRKKEKKESNDEKLRNYSKMVLLLNNTGSPSPFLTIKGKLFSYTSYGTCNSFYPWFWLQELGEFETNQLCTNLSQKAKSI